MVGEAGASYQKGVEAGERDPLSSAGTSRINRTVAKTFYESSKSLEVAMLDLKQSVFDRYRTEMMRKLEALNVVITKIEDLIKQAKVIQTTLKKYRKASKAVDETVAEWGRKGKDVTECSKYSRLIQSREGAESSYHTQLERFDSQYEGMMADAQTVSVQLLVDFLDGTAAYHASVADLMNCVSTPQASRSRTRPMEELSGVFSTSCGFLGNSSNGIVECTVALQ